MFPLTSNQRAIWFDQKLFPHASLYNVPAYTRIRGSIDPITFGKAIELLIAQCDVLRTEIFETDGIPQQVFKTYHPSDIPPLQLLDLSGADDSEAACMRWMQAQSRIPLAYQENRLYTFALLKKSDEEYFWFLNLHHTLADAWSNAVMIRRLAGIYEALINGQPVSTEPQFSYADYIADNLSYLDSTARQEDEQYWKQRFATVPGPAAIGIRDGKTEEGIVKSTRETMYLSGALYQEIQHFAARQEVTLFHTFLAALYTYFSRINQNRDLVIGAPVLNRSSEAFRNTVGLFVGVLPVRMSYPADISFEALVLLIRDSFREDMQHQRFPVDEIVRFLKAKEPDLRSLYDITLSFEKQNYSTPINGFETETASIAREGEKEPLAVFVRSGRTEQELKIDFDFNTGYWDTFYIEQFLEQFRSLLETLVHEPAQPIDKLPLVTAAIKNELLQFDGEQPVFPGTLVEHFEKTVAAYPDHTALVFGENQFTYAALNAEVNALAHHLRNNYQVQPEEIVAYMIPKSDKAIIALLAILKAGGAYLPIDPGYPEERKRYMLEDSGARLLLTTSDQEVPLFDGQILAVDEGAYRQESNTDPALVTVPDHISYVIYTSGSTGKPKGAVIRNEAAVNIVLEYLKAMQIKPSEHCLQFASLSFDASVLEIFMALFSGAALFPISKDTIADFDRFSAFIDEQDIAALILPPSFLRNLDKKALAKVRVLLTAGEPALSRRELGLRDDQQYYNAYGPTECTVCATIFEEKENTDRNVPIGKAIGNVQVFILDNQQQLLPPGVPGEICISGMGLGLGYLNNAALTAEKFIPSPFAAGKLMYRTGDVGRRLSDGNIEYLGRADDQVKIRGHRIEPGEIEAVLARHPAVENVAVVVKDRNNEKSLYAFVVTQNDIAIDVLYAFLRNELPHFMIPDRIFPVERIPLTMNGKVDRKELLRGTAVLESDKAYSAPATGSERLVATIWQELLDIGQVSTTDNFFQLGGHSLKVGQFINKLYRQTSLRLAFSDVFHTAVLRDLALLVDERGRSGSGIKEKEIQPAAAKPFYPLSSSQKRLYLLHQAEGSDSSYNIPRVFEVKGTIDAQKLEQCFRTLIQRHESLRTAFHMQEGVPVQHIPDSVPFSIEMLNATADDREKVIAGFIRTFDLAQPPLMRAGLCSLDNGSTLFLFDMHHIISDGLSAALLIDELIRLYQGAALEPLALQYKDFAEWQQGFLSSDAIGVQQDYWLRQFADEIPAFNLQTDFPRPAQKSFKGKRKRVILHKDTSAAIEALATQLDCTVNQLLLAAFKVLLFRYAANEDIVVGTPVAGRTRAELDKILGVFINTLALRSFPEGNKTFRSFLDEVRHLSVEALKNQDFPFEQLVEQLDLKRDRSRHPLFDVMFSFLYEEKEVWTLGDAVLEPVRSIYDTSKFDLLLEAVQTTNSIALNLEYSTDLFLEETMTRFLDHYVRLLQQLPLAVDSSLSAIDILSNEEEQALLLSGSKDLHVAYPEDQCLHQLFEKQVQRVPDNIALAGQNVALSYAALDEKVNQLAATIRQALPGAVNPIIAVLLDRGTDMVVTMLAILKAGGAYLPIDPEYPHERIAYTLEDSNTPLLITHSEINPPAFGGVVLNVDELQEGLSFAPTTVHPSDLAYIIYTSGSTGKPKGVMIEHRNVVRLLFNDRNLFDFSENDVWTLFHSYCFDFSVWELYGALLFGGKLVMVPKAIAQSAPDFLQLMRQHSVTVLNQTPGSFYNIIAAELEQPFNDLRLRYVIFGGEALKPAKLKEWHQRYPGCQLINMYGITETTVHVTYKKIGEKEIASNASNIGRPIPTLSLLVLDKEGRLVPTGVAGELCVGGAGLARGYLNRPELTAERFAEHPYEKGARIYKSGDLAKVLSNGDIEYLGRIDHQVKIRGFRIELGEIESKLLLHPEVSDVLVMDKEDAEGTRFLCAYVVAPDTLQAAALRQHLAAFLPDYMIPAFFIVLPQFPLNANGKIDRKKLPQPEESNLSTAAYEAPQTAIEKRLAELWMKLLRVRQVGLNDQFFELGGHSLKAAQLAALIHKHFHVELSIKDIFRKPGLRDMAAGIQVSASSIHHTIGRAPELPFYPASSAEKRLFILDRIDGASISYNIPMAYSIEGDLDLKKLNAALHEMMRRHEILRTSFGINNKEVIQVIHETADLDIGIYNCEDNKLQDFIRDFVQPFDLTKGPLIRVNLLRTYSGQYFLLMDLHHIITDGVSLDNFMQELAALYQGAELPELNIQAKDFAWWQKQWLQSPEALAQKAFWKEQLADEPPLLNMPTDFVRPAVKSYEGDLFKFSIPASIVKALRKTSRTSGATPFMLLLAAYNVLLSKYSGQYDITVGTAVAGRSHVDVQELIGMFVNTLPLRNFPAPEKTFLEFAEEVKEKSLKAIESQDYPFEELLDDLEIRRDMSRNPLFDHMFSYQAEQKEELLFADLILKPLSARRNIAKMDLSLEISGAKEGEWQACIEYATRLFSKTTIQRLAGHFNHILEQITDNPSIPLRDIELITGNEKEQVLRFNDAANPENKPDRTAARNIYELFAEKAAAYPDAVAVETDHEAITYSELNKRASRLAALLAEQGCGTDKIIGLYTDRSSDMVTGMLATFKAGGAYLPIDPEYPKDRIHYMLEDSEALLVLTQRKLVGELPANSIKILLDEIDWSDEKEYESAVASSDANALAYVIYTSGSTGKPKGVQIEHRALYNFLLSNTTNYHSGFTANDVCLSVTTVSFDVSVLEIFMPLINGAKLVLVTRENVYDVQALARVIVQKKVTFCYMPLSLLQPLYMALKPSAPILLNKLDVGAEPIKDIVLEQFVSLNRDMQIMNGYGPTEATIACSWFTYQPGNARGLNVSIGKPMHNTRIYIVNEQMQLQPIGVPGELCIAGDGLARGYQNNPQQTAEKFTNNPFEPGTKLYKTGDLAQWQEDGNISFIGRKDYQVKIRGFRIELGEIESKLMTHPDIREALVVDKTDGSGNKYLCAYIVSTRELDYATLKAYLAAGLPAYMIPSFFICLDKFPLTRNEKIDRKALPEPETGKKQLRVELAEPTNATEKKLLHIWQTVLDTEHVGVTDNFFELGGNSLRIINMLGLIQADFGDALKVSDLFDKPTVREQAAAASRSAPPAPEQSKKVKRVEF